MGSLFSKEHVSKQDKAILELKLLRDKLKQTHRRILLEAEKENSAAKEFLRRGDKQRAKLALLRKKIQMNSFEHVESQILNLEKTVMAIEEGALNTNVLRGIELGNKELAKLHKQLSPEKAQAIVDEFEDLSKVQAEIDSIIQHQFNGAEQAEINASAEEELEQILSSQTPLAVERAQDFEPQFPLVPEEKIPPSIITKKVQEVKKEDISIAI